MAKAALELGMAVENLDSSLRISALVVDLNALDTMSSWDQDKATSSSGTISQEHVVVFPSIGFCPVLFQDYFLFLDP